MPYDFPGGIALETQRLPSAVSDPIVLPLGATFYLAPPNSKKWQSAPDAQLPGGAVVMHDRDTRVLAPTSGRMDGWEHIEGQTFLRFVADGADVHLPRRPLPAHADYAQWCDQMRSMGVCGLGGSGFPTVRKLQQGIHTLIVNAVESDPWVLADTAILLQHPQGIVRGLRALTHYLSPERIFICVMDGNTRARHAAQQILARASLPQGAVASIAPRYPAGNEYVLIHALSGRMLPKTTPPVTAGFLCLNSGTVCSIAAAIEGIPSLERIVTLSDGKNRVINLTLRRGTPLGEVLQQAGYDYDSQTQHLRIGGYMMGKEINDLRYPVTIATNSMRIENRKTALSSAPCIRCHWCASGCPRALQPQELWSYAREGHRIPAALRLMDCIGCGVCDALCPSHLPLTQTLIQAQQEVQSSTRATEQARVYKQRFAARNARLANAARQRLVRQQQVLRTQQKRSPVVSLRLKAQLDMQITKCEQQLARIKDDADTTALLQQQLAALRARKAELGS